MITAGAPVWYDGDEDADANGLKMSNQANETRSFVPYGWYKAERAPEFLLSNVYCVPNFSAVTETLYVILLFHSAQCHSVTDKLLPTTVIQDYSYDINENEGNSRTSTQFTQLNPTEGICRASLDVHDFLCGL